jgi:signal transduction histidine kinase
MPDLTHLSSLRVKGLALCLGSLVAGALAAALWMQSDARWQRYLDRAYVTGVLLYDTLLYDAPAPPEVTVARIGRPDLPVPDAPLSARDRGRFFVTSVSILSQNSIRSAGTRLQLHILSPDLRYPVSDLMPDASGHPAANLGNLTRMLAQLCSEPLLFARVDRGDWRRIDGSAVWACSAAPADLRLLALAILILAALTGLTQIGATTAQFARFSEALRSRARLGGHDPLSAEGPEELREITRTVNDYLASERDRLQKRTLVLSGVSHDLGTPATRLRLRTALIEDDDLRHKLERDIDQMTDMIESVLTYTRAEMSAEESVSLSLTSLVQSIVADYEDIGKPVQYCEMPAVTLDPGRTVFGAGQGGSRLLPDDARRVLVMARPVSLRRAITNLIDNALKYGRHATVWVEATATSASIIVEDAGQSASEDVLRELVEPYQRGANTGSIEGVGLGLTIVSTIARQHGGTLAFDRSAAGLRSILQISRR